MAQLVNIAVTDNKGVIEENLSGNFAQIIKLAWKEGENKYPWITSIDEYGNTYINPGQARHLIRELKQLNVGQEFEADKAEVIQHLEELKVHTLLAFFGD